MLILVIYLVGAVLSGYLFNKWIGPREEEDESERFYWFTFAFAVVISWFGVLVTLSLCIEEKWLRCR